MASGGYSPMEVTIIPLKARIHKTQNIAECNDQEYDGGLLGQAISKHVWKRGIWATPVKCGHQSMTCRMSPRRGKGESERKTVWLPSSTPVHTAQIFLFPSPLFVTRHLHTNEPGKLDETLAWRQVGQTTHTPRTLCATRQGGVHFWPVLP